MPGGRCWQTPPVLSVDKVAGYKQRLLIVIE
ncbi:Uncharacterised protein [BD1-7 clade bacterium]|uniref:Uncharacterized protein n=1 Tax=BD1-7 clade bacterium TaxID=2029982 RepID=A0A5S9MWF1_9GAMM|nr:Uncharacterised protein [BD1-7 clade bacterium]